MKQCRNLVLLLLFGLVGALTGCGMNYYPPVYVHSTPQASSMHYGPPPMPVASAAEGMHYGPPSPPPPAYPSVTVTNPSSEADSMHYGN